MTPIKFDTVPVAELVAKGLIPDAIPPPPLILVVDDEVTIADTLVVIFEKAGFAASAAYDGDHALEIARLTPPDLLLTDVVMPGLNGVELALLMTKLAPDCQILLLSGQAMTADLLARSGVGREQFVLLAKPIHPTKLIAEVSRALRTPFRGCRSFRAEPGHRVGISPSGR